MLYSFIFSDLFEALFEVSSTQTLKPELHLFDLLRFLEMNLLWIWCTYNSSFNKSIPQIKQLESKLNFTINWRQSWLLVALR